MNWFTNIFRWFFKPQPVTEMRLWGLGSVEDPENFFYYDRVRNMKIAKVEASWAPSVSPDVISQHFTVTTQEGSGVPMMDVTLSPSADSAMFEVPERTSVTIEVKAWDGTFFSDAASLTFEVEDLSKPLAPTALFATIVEVRTQEFDPNGFPIN